MQTSLTDSEYISKTQGQAWCISEAEEPNEMYCCKQLREKIPHIVYNKVILSVDDLFLFSNLSCHCQRKCYFFPATTFFPQASGIGSFRLVSSWSCVFPANLGFTYQARLFFPIISYHEDSTASVLCFSRLQIHPGINSVVQTRSLIPVFRASELISWN